MINGVFAMPPAPDLARTVARLTLEAEAHWGEPLMAHAAFAQRLRAAVAAERSPAEALARIHTIDLYLAQACAGGSARAMSLFSNRHLSRVGEHLAAFRSAHVTADEVRRELEDALLLGRGESAPRIGQYSGRGPLDRFVATAARNTMRSLLRRKGHDTAADDVAEVASKVGESHPSSRKLVVTRYEGIIRDAVRASLPSLDRRQRTILRLHMSQGVPLTHIARMLRVHQSTVSRTLEAAIDQLYTAIRKYLREVYGFNDPEMDSIIRDVRSRIESQLVARPS